ncbi:helix-turn-helix transcriptional regulator [Halomicroarcula sp. GCM10025709]|uniref:helix-turn-helix transcriptional regulator n=1 Tax=Haloarcula TaxID=2237 RepID=UPI0024C2EE69|nr:hypothetical protein [Halomicroarcula sp. YJ-61-S]
MSARAVVVVVAVLVVSVLAGIPAVAGEQQPSRLQTPERFDETTFRVTAYANGSARWTIEHRTPLANESERGQFEEFAQTFESAETPLYADFVEQAGLLTQFASNRTGRPMTPGQFQRSASIDPVRRTGAVRMSFQWTNFTRERGERVVMSDVFEGGFYIGPNQSFVVERGPDLAFTDARPTPDSRSDPNSLARSSTVTWEGERSFNDRRPYVELGVRSAVVDTETATPERTTTQQSTGGGTGDTDGSDGTAAATPQEGGGGSGWLFAVVAVVVLAVGGAAVWRFGGRGATVSDGSDGGTDAGGTATPEPAPDTAEPAQAQEPAVPDEELLSDSDRVLKLLRENGGRMKQVDIVDGTDWSKSKVSMLLSDMEDDDEISKLRVGRENIISLAGEEPDAAGSPFEEE